MRTSYDNGGSTSSWIVFDNIRIQQNTPAGLDSLFDVGTRLASMQTGTNGASSIFSFGPYGTSAPTSVMFSNYLNVRINGIDKRIPLVD